MQSQLTLVPHANEIAVAAITDTIRAVLRWPSDMVSTLRVERNRYPAPWSGSLITKFRSA